MARHALIFNAVLRRQFAIYSSLVYGQLAAKKQVVFCDVAQFYPFSNEKHQYFLFHRRTLSTLWIKNNFLKYNFLLNFKPSLYSYLINSLLCKENSQVLSRYYFNGRGYHAKRSCHSSQYFWQQYRSTIPAFNYMFIMHLVGKMNFSFT